MSDDLLVAPSTVRLVRHGGACAKAGHVVCWRVRCRGCGAVLAPHLRGDGLAAQVFQLGDDHLCAV